MIRPSATAFVFAALLSAAAALAGCSSSESLPEGIPSFYRDLATSDAVVDAAAAKSMISGYRANNGLGPVTLDPELMKMAADQARVRSRIASNNRVLMPVSRLRISAQAITPWRKRFPAGAIHRRTAPTCSTTR
jgi:hypothetical protein